MSTFSEHRAANRRLTILRLLEAEPDYALNDSVMQAALEQFGHGQTRDAVRTDFAWLQEQGLVTVEVVAERVHCARITDRGVEVARGRATVPGVQRPSPGQ